MDVSLQTSFAIIIVELSIKKLIEYLKT